jgi:phage shock protein B
MGFVLGIIFLTVILPLWLLLHYITQWRKARGLSKDDERMLEELWETAIRMEDRVRTLEQILDSEAPDWRRERK